MNRYAQIYDIDHLARVQAEVLGNKNGGFHCWKPARAALSAAPLKVITNRPGWADEFAAFHEREAIVPAQGVYHLHDCLLRTNGEIVHADCIVREQQHLGEVAVDWAQNGHAETAWSTRPLNASGVSIIGPGYKVYGHWLVDFIPKLIVAVRTLGADLGGAVIPLPKDTPKWARAMVANLCPIADDRWLEFDGDTEQLQFSDLYVPTFAHSSTYFHPWVAEFLGERVTRPGHRKLCITRRQFTSAHGVVKHFAGQELFEAEAVSRGFEIVIPEKLNFVDQIDLFNSAKVVVGEYGSALHNMMFAPIGAVCGVIRCPNDIQLRIAAMRRQSSVIVFPEQEETNVDTSVSYTLSYEEIVNFFDTTLLLAR